MRCEKDETVVLGGGFHTSREEVRVSVPDDVFSLFVQSIECFAIDSFLLGD